MSNTGSNLRIGIESATAVGILTGSSNYSACIGTLTANKLHLGTNSTVRLTIDSAGLVGIGTSSPQANLQVTSSAFPVLKVADGIGGGAVALGDSTISGNYVGIWRGAANSISGGGFLNIQGNNIAFMSTDAVFGSATRTMTLDNSGNLLVGTTSAVDSSKVQISGAKTLSSGIPQGQLNIADTTAFATGVGGAVAFSAQYQTGLYTTMGSVEGVRENGNNGDYAGNLIFRTRSNGGDNTERAKIASNGYASFGALATASGTAQFSVFANDLASSNGIQVKNATNSTGGAFVFFTNNAPTTIGSITQNATTTVAYNTSSDYRMKENVVPMTGALDKIAQLKPVTYKWREEFGGEDGQGFIAHELAEIVPDCVSGQKDAIDADGNPKYQGVDTSFLVATLVSAIQEQQSLIESMAAKLKDAGVAGF
jgi:hypothetical protein